MEKKIKVAAVGDNCVDAYDQTGEAFPGGNPVNVAVYTVRLGGEASYTGVVGDDAYGKLMKDSIAKKGVDVSHLKVMPGSTAVTHVEIIDGERILGDYEEGVMAEFKLSEEDIEFLGSHDLVVSGIWGMIENDLEKIKACGTRIAFDFATKYESPVIDIAIPFVDYAFLPMMEKMKNGCETSWKKCRKKEQRQSSLPEAQKEVLLMTAQVIRSLGLFHAMSWIRWEPVTASLQAFYMVSYRENHYRKAWNREQKTAA